MLPVLPFGGPANSLLGSSDTLLMEMIPEFHLMSSLIRKPDTSTYRSVNVLIAECFRQEAAPPEEVDDVPLVDVPLPQAGPLDDVVGEGGHSVEGGGVGLPGHEQPVGGDEGVDGVDGLAVLDVDLDPVLREEVTLRPVCRTGLTGGTADWEGAPGAGEERRSDWGQTAGTHRTAHQPRAPHPRTLRQDCLPGPDVSGGHQGPPSPLHHHHPPGETLGVGTVELEVVLPTHLGRPAPGALKIIQINSPEIDRLAQHPHAELNTRGQFVILLSTD